jgi:hypothetical protein
MSIIVHFEQNKSGDFRDKSRKCLTDSRIFSENNRLQAVEEKA